jgi:hypothetical protein
VSLRFLEELAANNQTDNKRNYKPGYKPSHKQ